MSLMHRKKKKEDIFITDLDTLNAAGKRYLATIKVVT
jgi:hypothetical protein